MKMSRQKNGAGHLNSRVAGRENYKGEPLDFFHVGDIVDLLTIEDPGLQPKTTIRLVRLSFVDDIGNGHHDYPGNGKILEFSYQENYGAAGMDRFNVEQGSVNLHYDLAEGTLKATFKMTVKSIFGGATLEVEGDANVAGMGSVKYK